MRRKTAIIITSSLGALALVSSILAFIPFAKSTPDASLSSWMGSMDDDTKVTTLAIPGTHDSAATHSLLDVAGKCQDLSIEDQLKSGARFLDFRLVNYKGSLTLYHGSINQNQSFETSLATLYSFLESNNKETIFLSIKEEGKAISSEASFETLLTDEIVKHPSYWYIASAYPATLGLARGQIVLLSRYANPTIGVPLHEGWKDLESQGTSNTFDIGISHIQDYYKVNDVANKQSEITSAYAYSKAHESSFSLNFLSGYLEKGFPPSYSITVAKTINPWIKTIQGGPGISIMDFFSKDYGSLIVGWNNHE